MQTHRFQRRKLKAKYNDPDAYARIMALRHYRKSEDKPTQAEYALGYRMKAMQSARREEADIQEYWHCLVACDDRSTPIKWLAMSPAEAERRNKSVNSVGFDWTRRDKPH